MEGRSQGGPSHLQALRPGRVRAAAFLACVGLIPGLVLGVLFAQLLFFLNPDLPFEIPTIARAAAFFGSTGGCLSSAAVLLASRLDRRRGLRLLPWGLTVALSAAALLGWVLPSHFAYYLPPGINTRLIKAAVWITAGAVVCFYTSLLHGIYRRRYGWRSRLGLAVCVVVAFWTMAERRGAFRPAAEPFDDPGLRERAGGSRLLVVGLDSATLDAILPLAERGVLPFLARVLEGGSHGHLRSVSPLRKGAAWTSLSTGKLPYQHGVLSSRRYRGPALPRGLELSLIPPFEPFREWAQLAGSWRLADGGERKALALWEVLSRLDLPAAVVAWPLSDPLRPELPSGASEAFFNGTDGPESIRPPELRRLALEVQSAAVVEAPPGLPPELDQALIGDRWRLDVARGWFHHEPALRAVFVGAPGLRAASLRYFGGYSAAQFEGVVRPPYPAAEAALSAYYQALDGCLEKLWREQDAATLLALVSAYGVSSASGWARLRAELSEEHSVRGAFRSAPDGVILLYGQGIAAGGRIDGAFLVDVVPTLLYALGLPVANDLDGRVLRQAFDPAHLASHPLTFVRSYEGLSPQGSDLKN